MLARKTSPLIQAMKDSYVSYHGWRGRTMCQTQSCCTHPVRAQLWVKRPAVAWAKVQKWAWCHMWKAFKSALGIQKFHKRGNPVSVQLADEAIQRYFEDIMWSNSFNIVIGQCFSLVHHKTCRDSQKQSTITPPSRLEILNLGILTIFQVSSETGEWRLGPAATVHPSTQTAEHQSHPGVERGPAPPHVRDQMDQIGAKTVSSLTNETTFFSSFFLPHSPAACLAAAPVVSV